jgi:transposase InsO family protein
LGVLFVGKISNQETLKRFLRHAQNEFGLRIKKIRSDSRTEFENSKIEGFLKEEGIKHEFSSPYTPQQNCVVERNNRTLLDMARTMLDEYKTPDRFWAETINTACYFINRLYLHRILKKTSFELLIGKKHNVSYFRVFGSKCFIFY